MPIGFLLALIGLMAGGVRGLFIGFVIGYLATWILKTVLVKKLASVQTQFLESTFAVTGALCKADGVVTRDEIAIAESMFDRLHLSGQQREHAGSDKPRRQRYVSVQPGRPRQILDRRSETAARRRP